MGPMETGGQLRPASSSGEGKGQVQRTGRGLGERFQDLQAFFRRFDAFAIEGPTVVALTPRPILLALWQAHRQHGAGAMGNWACRHAGIMPGAHDSTAVHCRARLD